MLDTIPGGFLGRKNKRIFANVETVDNEWYPYGFMEYCKSDFRFVIAINGRYALILTDDMIGWMHV